MIHPTAIIESGAEIGENVEIGPRTYVASTVRIGDGCRIGVGAVILDHVTIGPDCKVHACAVLGDEPQDYAYENSRSYVVIGRGTVIREGATVHRGTQPESSTTVGDGCFLMSNSHVGHNCIVRDRAIVANGVLLAGYADIGEGAFLSGNSVVHQFCRIGRLAMMSGGAAVSKDVPPFFIAHSNSTNAVSGVNVVGMKRAGLDSEARKAARICFKTFYLRGFGMRDAIKELRENHSHEIVTEICDFVAAGKRGITGYHQ